MWGTALLVILILVGLVGKSNIIATAACMLLVLKLLNLQSIFPVIERRGLELGLLFLIISVLVPFAEGKISAREIGNSFLTIPGLLAILGGALATHMNGQGLEMLKFEPELMIGLVIGAILGIVFWGGIPVGPLMAAGITALFMRLFNLFQG